MKNRELAEILLQRPDGEVTVSLDISTGVFNEHGDEIIAKIFGYGIIDAFHHGDETTIHFEDSGTGGEGVDVIEVVKKAQSDAQEQLSKPKIKD